MIATAITLGVMGIAIRALTDLAEQDGRKILAAFQGRPWPAKGQHGRAIPVRISSRDGAAVAARQELLAAA